MIEPNLKESILTSPRLKITLDGKKIGDVTDITIKASISNKNIFINFDGTRLETDVDSDGKTRARVKNDETISYSMSEMALKEHNGTLIVKSIEVDENGSPTINVITLLNQGETQ